MRKITQIKIERMPDYEADLSYLGTFGLKAESDHAIAHDGGARAFPYFNSTNATNKMEAIQDYERLMDYDRGRWWMIGIRAFATIETKEGDSHGLTNRIASSGLWGIESDSGDEYIKEIGEDQLSELKGVLYALGFTASEVAAVKVEIEE